MIDSYSIDVLDGKEKWLRLVTINAHGGEVYNRGPTDDMKQARRSNIERDTFDYAIATTSNPTLRLEAGSLSRYPRAICNPLKTRD